MYLISNKDTIDTPCCITPWSIIHFLLGVGFIILNLNCVGAAKSNLVGCLDNAFVCVIWIFIHYGEQKKGANKSPLF